MVNIITISLYCFEQARYSEDTEMNVDSRENLNLYRPL